MNDATTTLTRAVLEQISRVQSLVGGQQNFQYWSPLQAQILPVREQSVFLSFDKTPVLVSQSRVFAAAHFVQSLAQVTQNMEFVEQDRGLWRVCARRLAKRYPHVHHC